MELRGEWSRLHYEELHDLHSTFLGVREGVNRRVEKTA